MVQASCSPEAQPKACCRFMIASAEQAGDHKWFDKEGAEDCEGRTRDVEASSLRKAGEKAADLPCRAAYRLREIGRLVFRDTEIAVLQSAVCFCRLLRPRPWGNRLQGTTRSAWAGQVSRPEA